MFETILNQLILWVVARLSKIDPALGKWAGDLLTKEGRLALQLAAKYAQAVLEGKDFKTTGQEIVKEAAAQGTQIAIDTALNALRTQVNDAK